MISVFANAVSLFLLMAIALTAAASPRDFFVDRIFLQIDQHEIDLVDSPYRFLLHLHHNQPLTKEKVRASISDLYKTLDFSDIEVRIQEKPVNKADVFLICRRRFRVDNIHFPAIPGIPGSAWKSNLFSLKQGENFRTELLEKAEVEASDFLKQWGYFAPKVHCRTLPDEKKANVDVHFDINPGPRCHIRSFTLNVDLPKMEKLIQENFLSMDFYIPQDFKKREEKSEEILKKKNYFYPELRIEENFSSGTPSYVDLVLHVNCGSRYEFKFMGMPKKIDLVRSVWTKRVFEVWAKEESNSRITNYLKNEGYWNCQVQSDIISKEGVKHIVFSVIRGKRYKIGEVIFSGNQFVSEKNLKENIHVDKLFFDRYFWVRMSSLVADLNSLKLYYSFLGFSNVSINVEPIFHGNTVDFLLQIEENERLMISGIQFSGNRSVSGDLLLSQMRSVAGGPFLEKVLNMDISLIQEYYWNLGYEDAEVILSLSGEKENRVEIRIKEGEFHQMGECIVIGGSGDQRKLVETLFPMKKGEPFSRVKLERFSNELENSALFTEFRVEKLPRPGNQTYVLVKIVPDRGRFYGFGLGWVERKELGIRGTLEYQEKNIFNSMSTFSAMVQLTMAELNKVIPGETRGIIALDTPFFLKKRIHSTFSIWRENEIFPSFRFNRWGIGASFFKNFSDRMYLVGSLRWYQTKLTELDIPPYGVDQVGETFDTTALSFSLVRDNRDDPFNPSRGDLLSADMKVGLPIFERNYTFLKFFWNYQHHYPFLKNGVLSFSFRNGFGFGDMSITERFFAGGSHSFRGTRNDWLGPLYFDEKNNDKWPQGGNVLVLLNLEATFPFLLFPIDNLYYSIFIDLGNIFEKSSQLDFTKMERALGIGLKFRTPIGPIRLEVAWNPRKEAERSFNFQFGIGNVF